MKYIKYKVDLVRYYCRFLMKRKEFKSLLNCENQSTQTLKLHYYFSDIIELWKFKVLHSRIWYKMVLSEYFFK